MTGVYIADRRLTLLAIFWHIKSVLCCLDSTHSAKGSSDKKIIMLEISCLAPVVKQTINLQPKMLMYQACADAAGFHCTKEGASKG